MARPFWLRLFGVNGIFATDDVLKAFPDADSGDRAPGSRVLQMLMRLADRGETLDGAPHISVPAPTSHDELAVVSAAALAGAGAQGEGQPAPAAGAGDPGAAIQVAGGAGQSATIFFGGMAHDESNGVDHSSFTAGAAGSDYYVAYSEDFLAGLVVDARTKTILTEGPLVAPQLGAGPDDVLVMDGDYSSGVALPSMAAFVETIVLHGSGDYNLIAADQDVAAGKTLTIDALGAGGHVIFDGTAETDGRFVFLGSQQNDVFFGGAGDDRITGSGGADTLAGGGGSDTFVYNGAAESSGPGYDTLADFNPATDHIDLPGAVTGFGATIVGGALSLGSFNGDLGAVLGGLAPSQAVWFAPDSGDLAGQIFLVVDANGQAGYQPGQDYVFAVSGAPLADLTAHGGGIFV